MSKPIEEKQYQQCLEDKRRGVTAQLIPRESSGSNLRNSEVESKPIDLEAKVEELVNLLDTLKVSNMFYGDKEAEDQAKILQEVWDYKFKDKLKVWARKNIASLLKDVEREKDKGYSLRFYTDETGGHLQENNSGEDLPIGPDMFLFGIRIAESDLLSSGDKSQLYLFCRSYIDKYLNTSN